MFSVSVPIALFTVVVRRFLETLNRPTTPIIVPVNIYPPMLVIFSAVFYYYYTHIRRGTLIARAKNYLNKTNQQRRHQQHWVHKRRQNNNSWMMRNLNGTRDNKSTAMQYIGKELLEQLQQPERDSSFRITAGLQKQPYLNTLKLPRITKQRSIAANSDEDIIDHDDDSVIFVKSFKSLEPSITETKNSQSLENFSNIYSNNDSICNEFCRGDAPNDQIQNQEDQIREKNYYTHNKSVVNRPSYSIPSRITRKTRSGRVYGCFNSF